MGQFTGVDLFRCEEEPNEIDHRARDESFVILMTQSCRFQTTVSKDVSDLTDVYAFALAFASLLLKRSEGGRVGTPPYFWEKQGKLY